MKSSLRARLGCCLSTLAVFSMALVVHAQDTAKGGNNAAKPASASTDIEERIKVEKWSGDLDGIAKRRFIRVLVVPGKIAFYFNGSQMQGAIYDFVNELETFLNKKLNTGNLAIRAVFIPVGRDKLIPMLAEGRGDLVATLVAVSEQRQKKVDFSDPLYDKAKGIIVSGPLAPPVSVLDDLSGKKVYYYANTIPYEKLTGLSDRLKKEGKPAIDLTPADANLQDDDLVEMVSAGLVPMTVQEDRVAQFWVKIFPKLQLHRDMVVAEGPLAWAMQKNAPQLKAAVNEFIKDHKVGTAYGNAIGRRYLRDVKWAKPATEREDLARFENMLKFFREYGDKYKLPYLLLAAQGYQESRLNPDLKSPAGAVGVMQIKPSTAASKQIGILNVQLADHNIEAGAKYLRFMVDQYYAKEPMDIVTKGLFALASYNAGPARIASLRKKAAAEGYDPNLWFGNVEMVASESIGRETVTYVSNIYKYYLAYKMVTEQKGVSPAAEKSGQSSLR